MTYNHARLIIITLREFETSSSAALETVFS